MFKFIHTADIHLDSPLKGLSKYEGAPQDKIREATRRALANLVKLAIDQQVAFVLIAGDIYDGDWKDFNTGLYFASQMSRLREANIPVVMIRGNHDAASVMSHDVRLPENVAVLSHEKPESFRLETLGVSIHGQGFANKAVTKNLAKHYPPADPGQFNIGLLHTSVEGSQGHEPYAPCSLADLENKGYDYWALGHVHQRTVLCEDPPIIFSGNIQGRHIRETGAKGCMLVTVNSQGEVDTEFRSLDVFRWAVCEVNATGCRSTDEVVDRFAQAVGDAWRENDELPMAVRAIISGACPIHSQLAASLADWKHHLQATATDEGGGNIWLEKVALRTTAPPKTEETALAEGPIAELIEYLSELSGDDERLIKLGTELDDLVCKLPQDGLPDGGPRHQDPEWIRGILQQVEPLLVGQLTSSGDIQ